MSAPEVEALVEVAAGIAGALRCRDTHEWCSVTCASCVERGRVTARAVLAAVAGPLMALGGERLAEVEARLDRQRRTIRRLLRMVDRAEVDLAAAEQRGREDNADHGQCYVAGAEALAAHERTVQAEALRELARNFAQAGMTEATHMCTRRADRLATQGAGDGEAL